MKIAVAGTGYVGFSLAVMLSQKNEIKLVDIIEEKIKLINSKKFSIQDDYIDDYLANKELNFEATTDAVNAYKDADYVIVATTANYDSRKNFFDTLAVESVIGQVVDINPNTIIVI